MKKIFIVFMILALASMFSITASAQDFAFNLGFDDGSGDIAGDSSGNGNDGTVVNAEWVDDGMFGGALQFNGVDSYVEVLVDVSEFDFTQSVWVKTDNPGVGIMSVLDAEEGGGGHDRHIFLVDGKLNFRVWPGGAWSTDAVVSDGEWHHIALVTKTGEGQTAYLDGEVVGTWAHDSSNFDWQKRVWIGFSNDAATQYFEGLIDNAAYINTPVPADGIGLLFEPSAVEAVDKLSTTWGDVKSVY